MRVDADFVIVGAGSAGCVLADRLSEGGARVILLEAGPRDLHPMIHIPAGVRHLLRNPRVNWNFASEPEPGSGGRAIHWPRGRVLGGSSSINGMLYVRGHASDYDTWAQQGCHGWSDDEVLAFFKQAESYAGGGDDAYRGRGGPLAVEDYRTILPVTHRFVQAAQRAGFAFNPDLNGAKQEGVGYSQMTRRGRFRASTARAYLARARNRPNLRVETGAIAIRLLFQGRRCIGVRYQQRAATHEAHAARSYARGPRRAQPRTRPTPRAATHEAHAAREVILCGGAVNSPHLLQISGIGLAQHLASPGVQVVHALPGVGANLSDHYVVRLSHRLRGEASINELSRGLKLAAQVVEWIRSGRGALTFGVTSAQVFCASRDGLAAPDLQLLFTPASYDSAQFGVLEREPGATVSVCPVRPHSRGTIMAASADPFTAPAIRPNYLSARDDLRVLSAGIRHARRIFAAPALAQVCVRELSPGPEVNSDESFAAFACSLGTTI